MQVLIRSSAAAAALLAARLLADTVKSKPQAVLGLATGRTMEPVYAQLIAIAAQEKISFSEVTCFNLDEYVGVPSAHPLSYRSYMQQRLFEPLGISRSRTFLPDGMAADLAAEAAAYEEKILAAGGIDLQILGLGETGHIGFNEPLSSLRSRTRVKVLAPETFEQCKAGFTPEEAPRRAITMGVETILASKRCLLLAFGERKAAMLSRCVEGPLCAAVTASALQLHRNCIVIADEPAAQKLQSRSYCEWLYTNDPSWDAYRSL
jgi:glucosamine-6-phosphate deaminase